MKAVKFLSVILILVALFGLVGAGLSAKDALDSKDYFEQKGKETDEALSTLENGLKTLGDNEPAYLEGRDAYEAGKTQYEDGKAQYEAGVQQYEDGMKQYEEGKAALEQAKQLVDGVEQLQNGFTNWQQGYTGLGTLAEAAGLPAADPENVSTYDAAIEQAGVEELKGVPQAVADGQKELAAGLASAMEGVMSDETMAASVEQASGMTAEQVQQTVAALPEMPYDQFNETMGTFMQLAAGLSANVQQQVDEGQKTLDEAGKQLEDAKAQLDAAETQLADAEKQLADGEVQLKQFEDGRDQIVNGLKGLMVMEGDNGLTSIADRLGKGFTFMKNDTDLDIEAGKKVAKAARDYSADSGDLITKEVVTRVIGAGATLLASLLALIAGILGLAGKFKGDKVLSFLSVLLGGGGFAALLIAGSHYSEQAGASAVKIVLAAACAVAVMALINAIAVPKAPKAEK